MRPGIYAIFLLILAASSGQPQVEKPKGLPTGIWSYESQTLGGLKLPQGALDQIWVEITATSYFRCQEGLRLESKISTDPTRKPMEFQLEFTNPVTKKVSVSKGIYKFDGDRLTLCYDNSGKTRPSEFTSPDGEEQIVLTVLVRKKMK